MEGEERRRERREKEVEVGRRCGWGGGGGGEQVEVGSRCGGWGESDQSFTSQADECEVGGTKTGNQGVMVGDGGG